MIPGNLKIPCILIPALLMGACETAKAPFKLDPEKYAGLVVREAESPGDLIRKQAIRTFEQQYSLAEKHKAIAQSTNGTWAWSHGQPSPEAAIDLALERCRMQNHRGQRDRPCRLIIVDLYWAGEFF